MVAFNTIVFKLVNILMNRTDFDKELGVIKQITSYNKYDDNMISKLFQKQKLVQMIR